MRLSTRPLKPRTCLVARLALAAAAAVMVAACGADTKTSLQQSDDVAGLLDLTSGFADSGAETAQSDVDVPTELADGELCQTDTQCQSGACWWRRDGRRCAPSCDAGGCPDGLTCVDGAADGARRCADRWAAQCAPCDTDDACQVGAAGGHASGFVTTRCLPLAPDAGSVCVVACEDSASGASCPDGTACSEGFCVPDTAACGCSGYAVGVEAATTCTRANDLGACSGVRTCTTIGPDATACDAATPALESCNGVDDECDGLTDESPAPRACRPYACGGADGCMESCAATGACAPGFACDGDTGVCAPDGSLGSFCDEASACESGFCSNEHCCPAPASDGDDRLCCAEDDDCAALNVAAVCKATEMTGCEGTRGVGRCVDSICQTVTVDDPEGCEGQTCGEAVCGEGASIRTAPTCQPGGACGGAGPRACVDGNPCSVDGCDEGACTFAPVDGTTETACYTADAATRGRGLCQDGLLACVAGDVGSCIGEVGPAAEICNGLDDDCDGATDVGVEAECFPYQCQGLGGCGVACQVDGDCAAGNFCDSSGVCAPTGDNGSMCSEDGQCATGHCGEGVCCESGLCCNEDADCATLTAGTCEDRTRQGCLGFQATGRCADASQCAAGVVPAPAACLGLACGDGPACLADGRLGEAWTCSAIGSCDPGSIRDCSPFRCSGDVCPDMCSSDEDCMVGSSCRNGTCAPLADGSSCTADRQCDSAHCSQGVCCRGDLCCKTESDCSALNGTPVCGGDGPCAGHVDRGSCRSDFVCETRVMDAPAACQGRPCRDAACTNLTGGGTVQEGVNRPVCSATGQCVDAVRDCRQFETGAFCDRTNRTAYNPCANCSPNRNTCIAIGLGCRCE